MVRIGRNPDNEIVINEQVVSEYHASLQAINGTVTVTDLHSSNGVFVDGIRIRPGEPYPVNRNSVVTLGQSSRIDLGHPRILSLFSGPSFDITSGVTITIGRDSSCHVAVPEKNVSAIHAKITLSGSSIFIEDFSTNGTYINSHSRKVPKGVKTAIQPSDTILVATHLIPPQRWLPILKQSEQPKQQPISVRQPELHSPIPPPPPKYFTVISEDKKSHATIGRVEGNDIVIPDPLVSASHARIFRKSGEVFLEDMGSTNGTFVNGARIKGVAKIDESSIIRIANQQINLNLRQLKNDQIQVITDDSIRLDVDKLAYLVRDREDNSKTKKLLDEISMSVKPGELIAIMGPSGCGKTTLLYSLVGNQPPSAGKIYYNGHDLYKSYDAFRTSVGYVPQDDILFQQLTVYESLYYVCKLRLPPETTDHEIDARISKVLTSLRFDVDDPEKDIRNKLIGNPEDPEKKVLSGGQRKRINIAQELITKPKILFLDEPTSGLASKDATELIKLLRDLSTQEGVSVILTIHQPSNIIYSMFDHTVLLCPGGCLAYFGPAVPDSFQFFNIPSQNPDELLDYIDVSLGESQLLKLQYTQDDTHKIYVKSRQSDIHSRSEDINSPRRKFGIRQFLVLSGRNFRLKVKDIWGGTGILLIQAPIIAILILLAFEGEESFQSHLNVLFLLVVSAIWFGCNNSAREIVSERVIYARERMVNLKIPSYFLSKVFLMTLLCAFQCLILLLVNYWACELKGSFFQYFIILLVTATASVCLGLLLSTYVKSNEAAVGMVPILVVPQVILAGVLAPLSKEAIGFLAKFTVARWSFEALLNLEYADVPDPKGAGGTLIESLSFQEDQIGQDLIVLGAMIALFTSVSLFILYYRDIHSIFQRMKRKAVGK